MSVLSQRAILVVGGIVIVGWMGDGRLGQAAAQTPKPMMAEDVFKNIQVLKGISADDFMGTMGIMTSALGFDCSDCHANAGTDAVDWAADGGVDGRPRKAISRRMVQMVENINKTNFNSRQMVTCWTCHRNRSRPVTTPPMEAIYTSPPYERDDIVTPRPGLPPAAQILDQYIEAVGGAKKWAAITSFVGDGVDVGFGGFGGNATAHIYAKAPDQRTMILDYKEAPGRGDTYRSYDGKVGWLRTPLNVLQEYQLGGGELDGFRLEALLSFPAQIKQVLTDLRTDLGTSISDLPGPDAQTNTLSSEMAGQNRPVDVVQGSGPRGLVVTMYFDQKTHLLLRIVRYAKSPIGRVPTQVDYADYRDVNGVKIPFRINFAWLDGRDAIQLNNVRVNVPIEPKVFGKPPALALNRP